MSNIASTLSAPPLEDRPLGDPALRAPAPTPTLTPKDVSAPYQDANIRDPVNRDNSAQVREVVPSAIARSLIVSQPSSNNLKGTQRDTAARNDEVQLEFHHPLSGSAHRVFFRLESTLATQPHWHGANPHYWGD